MEDFVSVKPDIMNQGTGMQADGLSSDVFRSDFIIDRDLPPELSALGPITMNFAWSWLPGGVELFRDLAPRLWDQCEQNPRLLLKLLDDLTLQQWAADTEYVERLREFADRLNNYLQLTPSATVPDIAYFC